MSFGADAARERRLLGSAPMQRHLPELAGTEYDVLIVGGGAAGAAAAREAALRGLKTALIERDDFGSGASAHCFKVVHGGIRYLQHADVRRLRASCNERSVFLRLAPHLVKPLLVRDPDLRDGLAEQAGCSGAAMLDLRRAERRSQSAQQRPEPAHPAHPLLQSARKRWICFPTSGHGGSPAQRRSKTARCTTHRAWCSSFAMAGRTARRGCRELCRSGTAAHPRQARATASQRATVLTGERFDIRARVVLNAAGAVGRRTARRRQRHDRRDAGHLLRAMRCFVINRRPTSPCALAIQGPDAGCGCGASRAVRVICCMAPWRDQTLVGACGIRSCRRDPDCRPTDARRAARVHRRNQRQPSRLRSARIRSGARRLRASSRSAKPAAQGRAKVGASASSRGSSIIALTDGIAGLVTSISVRYTVARLDAVNALGCVMKQIYRARSRSVQPRGRRCVRRESRTRGAQPLDVRSAARRRIRRFRTLLPHARRNRPLWMPPASDRLTRRELRHAHASRGRDGRCRSVTAPMPRRQPRDASRKWPTPRATRWCRRCATSCSVAPSSAPAAILENRHSTTWPEYLQQSAGLVGPSARARNARPWTSRVRALSRLQRNAAISGSCPCACTRSGARARSGIGTGRAILTNAV